jgi:acyl-CoA synthetase (AMP-forming)/AMP-acid ligase II
LGNSGKTAASLLSGSPVKPDRESDFFNPSIPGFLESGMAASDRTEGNRMRIGKHAMAPIEALARRARISPNSIAFAVGDDRWKYPRLAEQAERLARGLAGRGLRKGERIALHMPNRPEFVVAVYACFHIGAVAVPLNNKLSAAELKPMLEQLRPALYIGDADLYHLVDEIDCSILPREKRFIVGDTREGKGVQPWASLLSNCSAPLPVTADVHSPAVLLATPGKTGVLRFVTHTQATLAALFGLPFLCGH